MRATSINLVPSPINVSIYVKLPPATRVWLLAARNVAPVDPNVAVPPPLVNVIRVRIIVPSGAELAFTLKLPVPEIVKN